MIHDRSSVGRVFNKHLFYVLLWLYAAITALTVVSNFLTTDSDQVPPITAFADAMVLTKLS